jgi:hypothetical protein
LSPFDKDNLIPYFGFGDSTTHDKHVFSFYPDHCPCDGMEEALVWYRAIVPHLRLAGPTSFAPIINAAFDIVKASGGQYHILVILAGGLATLPFCLNPKFPFCALRCSHSCIDRAMVGPVCGDLILCDVVFGTCHASCLGLG